MMVQNQRQVSSFVQLRKHRSNPAGEIGKDDNFTFLFVNLLQQGRIGFFQAEAVYPITGPFKGPGEYRSRAETVGIVVVKYPDLFRRPLPDLLNGFFHVCD